MSWEVMSDSEKTCSCGKGKVHIIIGMDDWNRTREYEEILCEECLIESKKNKEIQDERNIQYLKLSNDILIYFKDKYLSELLKYFEQAKSKKSIWEVMNGIGIEKSSLQSFYNHNKNFDQDRYIEKTISIENISKLINLINTRDEILEQMIDEHFEIHEKRENVAYNEAYRRYRKR